MMSLISTKPFRVDPAAGQRGLALVFVLLMMVIAITMALFAARLTILGDAASRNDRDRQVAFQSAELALNDAELDIMDAGLALAAGSTARGCKFGNPNIAFHPARGCSSDASRRGFCDLDASSTEPIYQQIEWEKADGSEVDDSQRRYVRYGEFTGRSGELTTGTGKPPVPASPPKYIVVQSTPNKLQILRGGQTMEVEAAYKVYALGYGVNRHTRVLLESQIYKPVLEKVCNS